ncbi:polysaccharide deacetylase [Alicyclobacillus fastidiosus]|uniref:Polysaccharide deacetylase n=1 Tax=Alicyclobacillus fastidiosus TaxID=392011 RepID=A0ABY6ZM43_9BACL|nr:polysaccharide deacetylase [Alicyclobacillus fastidiosus]WAH43993.1 polysaccharide deacetylase [Alicyclobacillus fastidiosus]
MRKRVLRRIFDVWELIFHKICHLEDIEPGVEHLFYITRRRYLGRMFSVDGVSVKRFDPVVELHINNALVERRLRENENVVRAMVQLIRQARQSLPALANAVQGDKYRDAEVLYGITFIHRGIERLGFQTLPLDESSLMTRITKWHLRNVLKMLNPHADDILRTHSSMLEPRLVVATKAGMIARYQSPPEAGVETAEGSAADYGATSAYSFTAEP